MKKNTVNAIIIILIAALIIPVGANSGIIPYANAGLFDWMLDIGRCKTHPPCFSRP